MQLSLAQALRTYAARQGTILADPVADGKKLKQLLKRGYKFLSVKQAPSGPGLKHSTARAVGGGDDDGVSSELELINPQNIDWNQVRDNIPYLSRKESKSFECDDNFTTKKPYSPIWQQDEEYFHIKPDHRLKWFGGAFGKPVYFSAIGINKTTVFEGEFQVVLSQSDLKTYELPNKKGVYIGREGNPVVAFVDGNIYSYVDVKIKGKSTSAELMGVYEKDVEFPELPQRFREYYDENEGFRGRACG